MSAVQHPQVGRASAVSASQSALKRWIIGHPIVAYLILAYAVSWTIFFVPLFSREGLGLLHYDVPPVQVFILLASLVGLAGSAFVVTAVVDGRPGVRALAGCYLRWRVGVRWYLCAVLGLLAVSPAGVGVLYGASPLVALLRQPSLLIGYLLQVVLVAALVNLWEETGWTGFMFTRLQPRVGALPAALLVAPCFGGIHLPLLFVTDGLTTGRLSPQHMPLFVLYLLVLFSVPVRVVAGWLYNNARGSLLLMGLLHRSMGAVGGAVLSHLVSRHADLTGAFYGSIAVLALLLIVLTRGRLSYRVSPDLLPRAAHDPVPAR